MDAINSLKHSGLYFHGGGANALIDTSVSIKAYTLIDLDLYLKFGNG